MKLTEFVKKYDDVEVNEKELCAWLGIEHNTQKWIPDVGQRYCFISDLCIPRSNTWDSDNTDKFRLTKRNVYQTKEQCQFALDMYYFCQERSFEPAWGDVLQDKWQIYLDTEDKLVRIEKLEIIKHFSPFYYPTRALAQEVIDKYSFEELEEYYGRV